jgi:hypothetical protein
MRKTRRNKKGGSVPAPSPRAASTNFNTVEAELVRQYQLAGTLVSKTVNDLGTCLYLGGDDIYAKNKQIFETYQVIENLLYRVGSRIQYFPTKEEMSVMYTSTQMNSTVKTTFINNMNNIGRILNTIRTLLSSNREYIPSTNILNRTSLFTGYMYSIIFSFTYMSGPAPRLAPRPAPR